MDRGLLRWQDVTRTVRGAAVRGLFGGNHRLSQLADGSWSLGKMDEPEDITGQARRVGTRLYAPQITIAGQPLEIGGVAVDTEPEPFFDLSVLGEVSGWIIMVGEAQVTDSVVQAPMSASLSVGVMPPSTSTLVRVPLALVNGRVVLTPALRLDA
jgi:hypothetical protein